MTTEGSAGQRFDDLSSRLERIEQRSEERMERIEQRSEERMERIEQRYAKKEEQRRTTFRWGIGILVPTLATIVVAIVGSFTNTSTKVADVRKEAEAAQRKAIAVSQERTADLTKTLYGLLLKKTDSSKPLTPEDVESAFAIVLAGESPTVIGEQAQPEATAAQEAEEEPAPPNKRRKPRKGISPDLWVGPPPKTE
jgi:hypothetical protein